MKDDEEEDEDFQILNCQQMTVDDWHYSGPRVWSELDLTVSLRDYFQSDC